MQAEEFALAKISDPASEYRHSSQVALDNIVSILAWFSRSSLEYVSAKPEGAVTCGGGRGKPHVLLEKTFSV